MCCGTSELTLSLFVSFFHTHTHSQKKWKILGSINNLFFIILWPRKWNQAYIFYVAGSETNHLHSFGAKKNDVSPCRLEKFFPVLLQACLYMSINTSSRPLNQNSYHIQCALCQTKSWACVARSASFFSPCILLLLFAHFWNVLYLPKFYRPEKKI